MLYVSKEQDLKIIPSFAFLLWKKTPTLHIALGDQNQRSSWGKKKKKEQALIYWEEKQYSFDHWPEWLLLLHYLAYIMPLPYPSHIPWFWCWCLPKLWILRYACSICNCSVNTATGFSPEKRLQGGETKCKHIGFLYINLENFFSSAAWNFVLEGEMEVSLTCED